MIESGNINTPVYPFNDAQKKAKVDEALEFICEEYRRPLLSHSVKAIIGPMFGLAPKPTEEQEESYRNNFLEGLQKMEDKVSQKYLVGEDATLADFYLFVFMIPIESLQLTDLKNFPKVYEWYNRMQEIKECMKYKKKSISFLKKVKFFFKFIMPVIKCMTCKC